MTDWNIEVGEQLKRVAIHEEYGGRRQGGIGPSRVTPNVLLFTDPAKGHRHGYFDGWGDDGCYHYAGEGQVGDQKMTQGNLAIFNHERDGRALRLFRGVSSGVCQYLGQFTLPAERPWYLTDAPETGDGPVRSVIMFRLRPIDAAPREGVQLPYTPPPELRVDEVDVEQQHTERSLVDPAREPYEAERREAALALAYAEHLRLLGHKIVRQRITPPGELKPLYTDIFDATENVLIEAKGSVTREAVRTAIGQLFDYRRHINPRPSLELLVPSRPRQDLINLCGDVQISVIWPDGDNYVSSSG
ncbi:restriction endonuclease [Streptomyces aurantiacus]|uniref:restriction endonuclease n=1 Tax=Streptomyces aurantiacus TaxID=47760 RepID=UPI00216ABFFE|nr:restriction endonuclease [Streptomyces aurantiacus]